jgi:hypothetical protein
LNKEDFASAYPRLLRLIEEQLERRRRVLAEYQASGREIDLYTGSPCLFCLQSFGKIPWRGAPVEGIKARSLPILNAAPASALDVKSARLQN